MLPMIVDKVVSRCRVERMSRLTRRISKSGRLLFSFRWERIHYPSGIEMYKVYCEFVYAKDELEEGTYVLPD